MSDDQGIKIVLIGECGVGKTNLIQVSIGKKFDSITPSSSSCSYVEKDFIFHNKKYKFHLWDTAGQEKFRSLNKLFMKDAKIVIIVFAINVRETFNQIEFWCDYAKETLGNDDDYTIALVGNKSDLYEDPNCIPDKELEDKAKELNLKLKITSAATDANGFIQFLNELMEEYIKKYGRGKKGERACSFSIDDDNKNDKKHKKGCCEK